MRKTAVLMLVLACVLGAGAVYMARDWLQQQIQSANQVEKMTVNLTTVVVAKRPLKFGDKLGSDAMEEVSWPVANTPKGGFSKVAEVLGTGERRVVLHNIQINEPILKSKISGFGGRATLSTVIDKGLRAVTIRVNDVNGVAGFVLPGDRVDILLTRTPLGAKAKGKISDVLMQNIKVLGIDQDSNEEKDKPKVVRAVTVEVTTDHSQKLALAQQVGTLSLTLRNSTNTKPITHRRIRVRDLVDDMAISDTPDLKAAISAVKSSKSKGKKVFARRVKTSTSVKVFRGVKSTVHTVAPERINRKRRTNKSDTSEPQPKPSGSLEKSVSPEQVKRDRPATAEPTVLQPGNTGKISAPVAPRAVKRSKINESTAWFGTPISPVPPIQSVARERLSSGSERPAKGTNVRYRD